MQSEEARAYCGVMEEIRRRNSVIGYLLSGTGNALYRATTIESACLQLRKVLELIAFGSLVANRQAYTAVRANFRKAWNAKRLLDDLVNVNPNFYPQPMTEVPSPTPGVKRNLVVRSHDYLTKEEFVEAYETCGGAMHAENPFGRKLDFAHLEEKASMWRDRIVALLNTHKIQVLGHDGFFLIHMKEAGDDSVHCYEFLRREHP